MRRRRSPSLLLVSLLALVSAAACGARFPRDTTSSAGGPAASVLTEDGAVPGVDGTAGGDPAATGTDPGSTAGPGGVAASTPSRSGPTPTTAARSAGGGPGTAPVEPGPAPGVSDTEIKIAYLLPITGAAPVPATFDEGANVYWEYVNGQGGINGRKVKVKVFDTESSASVGRQKAEAAIEEGHFMFVVLDRLENQAAIGAYLDSRRIPNISVQTPANLGKDQEWTFGVTIDHAVQGALIADYFVKGLQAQKVAIVYENTSALHPGRDAFVRRAGQLGAQVTYNKAIDGKGNDFSGEALDLSRSGATATWLYMAPETAAKLASQADAAGYHPTWFANSISWNFDLIFAVAPKALAGARAFSPWVPLSDPRTDTYKQEYRRRYNKEPDDLGIVGWGIGEIVAEALKRTGRNLGQNGFRNTMQNLTFKPQVWAPLAFGPGVRQGANVIAVFKESGGRWALERDFTGAF